MAQKGVYPKLIANRAKEAALQLALRKEDNSLVLNIDGPLTIFVGGIKIKPPEDDGYPMADDNLPCLPQPLKIIDITWSMIALR